MQINKVIAVLDEEIVRLKQAVSLLKGAAPSTKAKSAGVSRKRILSAEGRARIAAAQKARWAKAKRAAK